MITTLPMLRKTAGSFLYCVLFALLFSVETFAQAPTISNVSPTRITNRTIGTVTGTNFTGTTVKVGTTTISPGFIATTATSITFKTSLSGVVSVTKSAVVATGATISQVSSVAAPSSASVSRVITDFGGYWSTTTISTMPQPDTNHALIGFGIGSTIYSTGVSDAALT